MCETGFKLHAPKTPQMQYMCINHLFSKIIAKLLSLKNYNSLFVLNIFYCLPSGNLILIYGSHQHLD